MYPRSTAFDAAVQQSHRMATRCDILVNESVEQSLDIIDGNVTVDDTAIRRRATISLTDPTGELVPNDARDLLMAAGNEFQLWRGITYADGSTEMLSLGIFGISDVQIEDSGQGLQMNLDGFDRSRRIARAKMPNDYLVLKGENYVDAITNLLNYRYAKLDVNAQGTGHTTPIIVIKQGDDPWEQAQKMAAAIGYELYFDVFGKCQLNAVEDTDTRDIDWTYAEGVDAMLLYDSRRLNDENTYNKVVYTGETTSNTAPVRGIATDNDPRSPTYIKGPYGEVVYFESSPLVTTVEQATAAAKRQLAKSMGFFERIETISIVHPAHEIGDVVYLKRTKTKVDSIYVVDKLTIPMVHSRGMNMSTRARRIPEDEG